MVSALLIRILLLKTVLAAIMMHFACAITHEDLFFQLFHDRSVNYDWDGTTTQKLMNVISTFIPVQNYSYGFGITIPAKVIQIGAREVRGGIKYRNIVVRPITYRNNNDPDPLYSFYVVCYHYENGNDAYFKLVDHVYMRGSDDKIVLQVEDSTIIPYQ